MMYKNKYASTKEKGFIEKIIFVSEKYELIEENDSILVALSGGADSVSLFLALVMLKEMYKLKLEAAHVNHGIREEADKDEEFCRNLCKKYSVPFHSVKLDIPLIAKQTSLSEEAAGRKERYSFFNKVIAGRSFKIATAHNKNDCVENFLINAIRGVSPKGVPPKRENIIRPLIETDKKEIYEFLKEKNESFCEDKTNFETDYTRNKVRLELIPYIDEKFDTNFTKAVYNSLDVSYFEDSFLKEQTDIFIKNFVKTERNGFLIDVKEFSILHIAIKRRVLREIYYLLKKDGFISFEHIENVIFHFDKAKTQEKTVELSGNVVAQISKKKLIFKFKEESEEKFSLSMEIKLNDAVFIPELKKCVYLNLKGEGEAFFSDVAPEGKGESFILRTKKEGDRVYIKNVGHKKLKSLLIDKKIPKEQRDTLVIVEDNDGICFVEGAYRRKEKQYKYYLHIENHTEE